MIRTIDKREMRAAIHRVAKAHPIRTAGQCRYVRPDEWGEPKAYCIIGVVLHEQFDMDINQVSRLDSVGTINDVDINEVLRKSNLRLTRGAQRYARSVQYQQDKGKPWARALADAEENGEEPWS